MRKGFLLSPAPKKETKPEEKQDKKVGILIFGHFLFLFTLGTNFYSPLNKNRLVCIERSEFIMEGGDIGL